MIADPTTPSTLLDLSAVYGTALPGSAKLRRRPRMPLALVLGRDPLREVAAAAPT